MSMLSKEEFENIKTRAFSAPPGNWKFGTEYEQMDPGYYFSDANGYIVLADEEGTICNETIEFLIHANSDMLKLINEINRLNKLIGGEKNE